MVLTNELQSQLKIMASWKTFVAGGIAAVGKALESAAGAPHWMIVLGQGLEVLGVFLLGANARDNKVTSEEAGAK